ncbi:phospho-N-acetylmuramoyl-pentapeptide-transferase [Campylobacter pinnipediorum]|uniref:phospho-N-acetylmuramoyl-pentapeptide- transferase n=1 Tax=Campylobacter pinnipediorum TaxID=1965231 RepID=UPI00084DF579|nr:phospho-N-acetylmuramoyl-pentapeptide-transferase [Campylobacter pinnipediorum]AQW80538.1 phospho-N-acetylmuramoyl-pentapeptide transferase [Campylobacter pinnipediorum subsp. pinnipediorum]AQW82207.1 phospho-N-acetylmuramoyl-pentapeptide transferase [Campylobacter pinnipediorum subsp. pinnipediorum]
MFYYLYECINLNFFQYLTVRSGIAFFISFLLTIIIMPKFIAWAIAKNANQPIYELAPQTHQQKSNIPTMGGVVFVFTAVVATLLCARLNNAFVIISLVSLVGFCAIGFFDDFSKIVGKKNHAGITPKTKMVLLLSLSLILCACLYYFTDIGGDFYLPFYKFSIFNMGIFIILFWVLVLVATSNSVNLTDGLDGLATVPSIFSLITLSIFAYLSGHSVFSSYLFLPKIANLGEVIIVASALIGALMGFLWYNCYPAQVFMGDSGSLSIGGFIGMMGVMSKNEALLILIGFVFVVETMSVILQTTSYKYRNKKRIFLMAPIHHHFEMKGWAENKIIIRFWIIALLSNLIALLALKLR